MMDKQKYLDKGKLIEKRFSKILNDPKFSSEHEDKIHHWDIRFDVKGLKRIRRSDDMPNENVHWIEIKGITGHDGWLYGEADFFVFETNEYWVVVEKYDLQRFVAKKVEKVYKNPPELYTLYRRQGRKDILTLVTTYDLCYLSTAIETKL